MHGRIVRNSACVTAMRSCFDYQFLQLRSQVRAKWLLFGRVSGLFSLAALPAVHADQLGGAALLYTCPPILLSLGKARGRRP